MGHSLAGVTFVDSIVSGREQKRRFVATLHGGKAVGEGRKACMSSKVVGMVGIWYCTYYNYQIIIQFIWSSFKKK